MGAAVLPFPITRRDVPHTPKTVINRARKAGLLTDSFEVRAQREQAKNAVYAGATPEPIRLPSQSPELAILYAALSVLDRRERRAGRGGVMLDLLQATKDVTAGWGDDIYPTHVRYQAENGLFSLWNSMERKRQAERERRP